MTENASLFTAALGLPAPWEVADVRFDPGIGRIDFQVAFAPGARFSCPCCGAGEQPVHDTLAREWRHLNFFQYQAFIQARLPRVRCGACGKTSQVPAPLARPGSGFSALMEALVVTLAKSMTVREVARLLAVSDMRVWRTLDHYVDAAREKADYSTVTTIGLDETAARRGHDYISLFHDLEAARLLFATEGRSAEVVARFADDLEAHGGCAENVRSACIDMSTAYRSGLDAHLPWARVTFDEFHVIQLVNQAVDAVRRQEVKDQPSLKRTRYLWLKSTQAWTTRQTLLYQDLKRLNLKTARAFRLKEALRTIFRTAPDRATAEPMLQRWYSWARRCRLEPLKQVATTLKNHWQGILNAFDSRLTNARVEAINGLIQAAKAKARGYATTRHLITVSYLVAGNLTHLTASPFATASAARATK